MYIKLELLRQIIKGMKVMIDWSFPSNNNGPITGISDAGIETFKGSPYKSLTRFL